MVLVPDQFFFFLPFFKLSRYRKSFPPLCSKSILCSCFCHNICHVKYHRRRQRHPTPVLLPGKSHGRRSLVGCSPWGREELDTTEWLHFHFLLSCIGEGNGNPLQCSCLETPRDGVAQSRRRLQWLSSSSKYHSYLFVCVVLSDYELLMGS